MLDLNSLKPSGAPSPDVPTPKMLVIKKISMNFNGKVSTVINFTDVSSVYQLKQKEDANSQLKTLIASVHHEMLVPLKVNVEMAERLICNLAN